DYLNHLTDDGILTITRWVFDGLRLVSLAQAACDERGWDARSRIAIVQSDQVATFLLKRSPFTHDELTKLRQASSELGFHILYAPGGGDSPSQASQGDEYIDGTSTADYARLIETTDRAKFFEDYREDIRPTTDDRPFFFHTTKLKDQF